MRTVSRRNLPQANFLGRVCSGRFITKHAFILKQRGITAAAGSVKHAVAVVEPSLIGTSRPIRIAMMAITTKSSINVNPARGEVRMVTFQLVHVVRNPMNWA